jgi:hypothetical protein
MYSDPFYRITHLIKEEIRKYKWIEGEKGRKLSWVRARQEWTDAYREKFEKFLIDICIFLTQLLRRSRPRKGVRSQATRVLYLSPLNLAPRIGNSCLRDCFGRKPVQRFHDSNQLLCR